MGSKGRVPHPHLQRPLPGPGMVFPDPFGRGIRPPPGAFSSYEMLPPPEVMEQKLAAQHVEMQKLAIENQRLAATQGTLRQELAAAQHEVQIVHAHIGIAKAEREQHMRGLMDNIEKMEAEIQATEPMKSELQQARTDAQSLIKSRQELIFKVQQLTQDLQRAHSDVQQIPPLLSEFESLRQEYQHCRATYDYEKNLYNNHLESLDVMQKNYITMATEVEKLQTELTNAANTDGTGGPYGGTIGYNENDATGHYPVGHNTYDDSYSIAQGQGSLSGGGGGGGAAGTGGTSSHVGAQSGPPPARAGYDAARGLSYDAQKGPGGAGYNAQRGPGYASQKGAVGPGYDAPIGPGGHGYDAQRGPGEFGYDAQRGPGESGYDAQRGPGEPDYDAQKGSGYDTFTAPVYDAQGAFGYDAHRGQGYDMQRGTNYDLHRGSGYDAQRGPGCDGQRGPAYDAKRGPNYDPSKGAGYNASSAGAVGQVEPSAPYGFATPPTRAGSGFEARNPLYR